MLLHILAIGKKKSDYDANISEYTKRIIAPFSLSMEILEPLGIDNPDQCRIKESEKLSSKLKPGDYVIALDERGKDLTTRQFASVVETKLHDSVKRIVFVIGGAYGLDESSRTSANMVMRMSAMTLPHELARLVLAEQLYRVTNLISGGKYHHE